MFEGNILIIMDTLNVNFSCPVYKLLAYYLQLIIWKSFAQRGKQF